MFVRERFVMNQSSERPCVGILLPLGHHCYHSNDHYSYTEASSSVHKGTMHGLQEIVLTGVTTVAQWTDAGRVPIALHTAAVATAASLATCLAVQVQELIAAIHGDSVFWQRSGVGRGRRTVGLSGSKGLDSWPQLHINTCEGDTREFRLWKILSRCFDVAALLLFKSVVLSYTSYCVLCFNMEL